MSWKPNYSKLQIDNKSNFSVDNLEKKIGVNTLRSLINGGWTMLNYINGSADEYADTTGIDTINSINQVYNATNDVFASGNTASLLIQSETTNGSIAFSDSSVNENVITRFSNTQHSTLNSKFGLSSILFDGASDTLTVPDSVLFDFGNGDFTIDYYVNMRGLTAGAHNPIIKWGTAGNKGYQMQIDSTGNVLFAYTSDGATVLTLEAGAGALSINTWYHHAIVRTGTTLTLYIDGVSVVTATIGTASIFSGTAVVSMGGNFTQGNAFMDGFLENMRVVKGTALWTANFTPPSNIISNANFTLVSNPVIATGVPINSRIIVLHQPIDTVVLNTDIILSYSRDGGVTFTTTTLTNDSQFSSTINILGTGNIDLTTLPTGSSMVYKIETLNTKSQKIHGVWQQWN